MFAVAVSGAERTEYVSRITTFIAGFSTSCADMRLEISCRVALIFAKLWEMDRLAVNGFLDSTFRF